jgi:hypothetical protein
MKTTLTAMALTLAATTAFSAEAIRSNVPCAGGSAPGFVVISGTADYYVINGMNNGCPTNTTELPAGVHPFDLDEVKTYLASIGADVDYRLKGKDRDTRVTQVEVNQEVPDTDPVEFETVLVDVVTVLTTRVQNGGW